MTFTVGKKYKIVDGPYKGQAFIVDTVPGAQDFVIGYIPGRLPRRLSFFNASQHLVEG